MCGRMAITLPHDAMVQVFDATPANDLPHVPDYNVCATVQVHVVTSQADADATPLRRLRPMRWGFVPHWYKSLSDGPLLINARAETIAEKPAFRDAARARRCIIIASGFYEWIRVKGQKPLPFYIHPADNGAMALAGIWQDWQESPTCAVVTTAANTTMEQVHLRMPVVLAPQDWPLWLGEAGHGAAPLMRAAPEDALTLYRVGTAVNARTATGPELIAPLAE